MTLTSELLDFLISYPWPGNVREMQNLVERMVILAEGKRLTLADLTPDFLAPAREYVDEVKDLPPEVPEIKKRVRQSLHDIELAEVKAALKRHGGVQIRAARELGLTPRQMGYRVRKYKISRFGESPK